AVLDGVFLGTLAGVIAWLARGAVRCGACCRSFRFRRTATAANSGTTAAVLFALLAIPAVASAQSQQPAPTRNVAPQYAPGQAMQPNPAPNAAQYPAPNANRFDAPQANRPRAELATMRDAPREEFTVIVPFDPSQDPLAATRV